MIALETLPKRCYAILPSNGQLIQVMRGEDGYYPMRSFGEFVFGNEAIDIMNRLNKVLGVDWRTREAMQAGSMFGWDVPGANPEKYLEFDEDPIQKNPFDEI